MANLISVAYHSRGGNTRRLAEAIGAGAAEQGARSHLVDVEQITDEDWAILARSDGIFFGSPTHIGGPSATFVAFAEETSRFQPSAAWADKLAAGFTTSAAMEGGKLGALQFMLALATQHGMLWVGQALRAGWNTSKGSPADLNRLGYRLGSVAQCNVDEKPANMEESDLLTAAEHGRRMARLAQKIIGEPTLAEGSR
ncbi:flavodoxin family protein [Streptomyces sp. 3214.6]|uniref:flavodoxin family protein n=1 Tax=Streptomyces sp. 3214.6 TaxID=1882757 RepID=UPI00090C1829|nr:flavodoxin family protein [Streptomyces sp. 3214.6]SHI08613.1 Multimeric flavodoxin WrbA [Streptomyces sp. 3214.6]